VKQARYYWLLLTVSHLTQRLFGSMHRRIWCAKCWPGWRGMAAGDRVGEERAQHGRVSEKMSEASCHERPMRPRWQRNSIRVRCCCC